MMDEKFEIKVESEVGRLTGVLLHQPGQEIANMTPETAQRALYSDILNLNVATEEYQQLDGIVSYTFENGVTLFAEAFNLTDEYSRAVGRNPNMARFVTQTGRRYGLGVRWTY